MADATNREYERAEAEMADDETIALPLKVRPHADAAHTFLAVIPGYAEPVRVQVDLGMGETGTVPVLISADALPPHASRVDVEYVVGWLNALPPEARRLLGL